MYVVQKGRDVCQMCSRPLVPTYLLCFSLYFWHIQQKVALKWTFKGSPNPPKWMHFWKVSNYLWQADKAKIFWEVLADLKWIKKCSYVHCSCLFVLFAVYWSGVVGLWDRDVLVRTVVGLYSSFLLYCPKHLVDCLILIFHVNNYWCNSLSSEKVESRSVTPPPDVSHPLCLSSSGLLWICLVWGKKNGIRDACSTADIIDCLKCFFPCGLVVV